MKVTIDKNVLEKFISLMSENYVPLEDDIDKFAIEDEPIKAVEMMSTQLARAKPDVGDPDFIPGSIPSLADSASVIASEVPTDPVMIQKFYQGMHSLLDDIYDMKQDKELQIESRKRKVSNAFNKIKFLLESGHWENDPGDDSEDDFFGDQGDAADEWLKQQAAQEVPQGEGQGMMVAVEFIETTFNALLNKAGAPQDAMQATPNQIQTLDNLVQETVKGLESQESIEMQGIQLDTSELAMILKSDYKDYKSRAAPVQTAELPKPIQDPKLEKKTYTDLKEYLGFVGVSGLRQWYKKHVEIKFLTLLKEMASPSNQGNAAFSQMFSDTYKKIVEQMFNAKDQFAASYVLDGNPNAARAMEMLLNDITQLNDAVQQMGNVLDITDDDADNESVNRLMNTRIGNNAAEANAEIQKLATTFMRDVAGPGIIKNILASDPYNLKEAESKKLQEHITGKSNFAFTDKEESDGKLTATSKKFTSKGIDKTAYQEIQKTYLEALDEILDYVFLSPEQMANLNKDDMQYNHKDLYDDLLKGKGAPGALFTKMNKKSELKPDDIMKKLEDALIEYLADVKEGVMQESRMRKLKQLSRIISKCL
jgi:hypothetical protein